MSYGGNLATKHKNTQNGYQLNIDFQNHYHNNAYLGNQAFAANQALSKPVYKGEKMFFNIDLLLQNDP